MVNKTDNPKTDSGFAGSIPQIYERYLVPLIFVSYAKDLAERIAARKPGRILELAAGTGVVTRALANTLAPGIAIVATDLNQAMLDQAALTGASRPVDWQKADAMELPFPDEHFDAVVCQFGVMFFPDKAKAFAEARRVLRPGGTLVFSVWDRLEQNEFADVITRSLAQFLVSNPPDFLPRTPHGYHDPALIRQHLAHAGFDRPPEIITLAGESRADSARIPAVAYCEGTPLRSEIEAAAPGRLHEATDWAARALAETFGPGPVVGKIQAHIILIEK
jgi:ubiquinone/menaquinone biosynthesis C-methylase UbiE